MAQFVASMTVGSVFIALGVYAVMYAYDQITNQPQGAFGRDWSGLVHAVIGLVFVVGGAVLFRVAYSAVQ